MEMKWTFLILCAATFKYAVAQPPERNNAGDDRDLEPWPDDDEEEEALASKPNGGSTSAGGDEAVAASGGPRAEDCVHFLQSNGHVAVITTSEAPANQNQAEGFSGAPDGILPVADCSQAPVCPTAASGTVQNYESDADPLQNSAALAGTVDQSVETDRPLASDSGTSGATGVESVADEDGTQYVHTAEASAVPDMLGPQTPHLQEPGDVAAAGAEAGATALQEVASGSVGDVGERLLWPVQESAQEGPGWQAETSFHTSGGYSESSASEEEEEGEVVPTDHYLHDAFQPGLGHYDEKDYINLALQRRLRNGTLRQAQSYDVGDEEGDGHDHTLIKGADAASSPAPVQSHGAGFELTPFVSEQPEPAEEEDGESSDHFIDLAAQRRLREHFAQLSLLNTAETEGSDEESSDNGTLLPVQEGEEGQEGTSTLSCPSTWSPGVSVQDGVQNGQQAESDHHADIDLHSPDTVHGSLASYQDIDLHGNQDDGVQNGQQAESDHHADIDLHSPDALQGSLDSYQDIDLHANQDFGTNLNIHPPYTVESAAGPDPLPSGCEDGHSGDSSQDVDLHGSHGFGTSVHVHPPNAAGDASGPSLPLSSSGDVHHGQQATSDHHADIDVHSPSSSDSSQNAGLDENQDIVPIDLTFAPPQGSTAHQVPAQSTADGIGHVGGNVYYDRQAETDLEMLLHYNDPGHCFDAALIYMLFCLYSVYRAFVILLWNMRCG